MRRQEAIPLGSESNRIDEAKLKHVVDLDIDLVSFVDKLDSLIENWTRLSPISPRRQLCQSEFASGSLAEKSLFVDQ